MSTGAGKGPQVPSILDRLIDDEPDSRQDRPLSDAEQLHNHERAVARDLQALLNTRIRCAEHPQDLTEIKNTIMTFGIQDTTSSHLRSLRRRKVFLKELESMIAAFEPRLQSIRLVPLDNIDAADATLRFRIEADLHVGGGAKPVVFDSMLEPSGPFTIQGETDNG